MFKKLLAPFLALAIFGTGTAVADVPAPQNAYNVSGTGQTQPILLQGGNVCGGSVSTLTGSPTFSITAQSSSDYPANQPGTWTAATNVGSSGIITSLGAITPGVVSTTGVSAFRLNITAISGGTVQVVISCSGASASSGGGGGGGGTVAISPLPLPVIGNDTIGAAGTKGLGVQGVVGGTILTVGGSISVSNLPTPNPTISPYQLPATLIACPSAAPAAANSTYLATCNSSGVLNVSTPAPQPTVATYLQPTSMLVCPSTAPAVSNSTYIATCTSTGAQNVNATNAVTPVPAALPTATSVPTAGVVALCSGACTAVGVNISNSNAATLAWCSFYNTASPTLGTTAAVIAPIPVTALQATPVFIPPTIGAQLTTAFAIGCATTPGGAVALPTNTIFVTLFHY